MSAKKSPVPERRGLASRPGNSRKLLSRKARERSQTTSGASIESCFPEATPVVLVPLATEQETGGARLIASAAAARPLPVASLRKVMASPLLRPGDITPNSGTIVAAIVRLVVERGEVARPELINLMAGATFTHPKARPAEKGWSQGYVAGAIRNGFLAIAGEPLPADTGTATTEESQPC